MFVDPIRGIHLGQQSTRLHQQAGHMTASDQIGTSTQKHLASRGPSTYGSLYL
jgi:thiamine monophosphate synthase